MILVTCVCVCMCMCRFFRLRIIAHLTSVGGGGGNPICFILLILVLPGDVNDTCHENLWSDATNETYPKSEVQFTLYKVCRYR